MGTNEPARFTDSCDAHFPWRCVLYDLISRRFRLQQNISIPRRVDRGGSSAAN